MHLQQSRLENPIEEQKALSDKKPLISRCELQPGNVR